MRNCVNAQERSWNGKQMLQNQNDMIVEIAKF